MNPLQELLKVIPAHERERLLQASKAQRQLLEFYAQAHSDITTYFSKTFPSTGISGALEPTQYFEATRLAALQKFIEARVATLNTAVSAAMENAAETIRLLVVTQVAREAKALGIRRFGTPDARLLEKTIDDSVSRIHAWNKQWPANALASIRQGLLNGETYRQITERVNASSRVKGADTPAIAKARAHMLANVRFAVVHAANSARQDAYSAAIDDGIEVRKMWWSAIGSCCFSCAKMHGTIVGMDEQFPWEQLGLKLKPYEGELWHPPLHPNCRCRIIPVTIEVFDNIDFVKLKDEQSKRLKVLASAGIR